MNAAAERRHFDTLVVGSGASGAPLAARLSARPDHHVLLLEAGKDYGPLHSGAWPEDLLFPDAHPTSHDYDYWNEARPHGTSFPLSIARVIGGCTAHNAAGIEWGRRQDYEEWEGLGNPGWGWVDMQRCMARVESDTEARGEWHGDRGPVLVSRFADTPLSPFAEAAIAACESLGIPFLEDANDPDKHVGVYRPVRNVVQGVRWNSAFAYLDPVRLRANLRIVDETVISRVLLSEGRAVGVEAATNHGVERFTADRVVISAGAYNTPGILMRSGIGPSAHLTDLGIDVAVDLPGVGMNLQDHPVLPLRFLLTRDRAVETAHLRRAGKYRARQLMARAASGAGGTDGDTNFLIAAGEEVPDGWECQLRAQVVKPASRGTVRLSSTDPHAPPLIDSCFLQDPDGLDARRMLGVVALIRELAKTEPLAQFIATERRPGADVVGQQLLDHALANVSTHHHPSGTCRMGPDADALAVVDAQGRVRGVEGLFVADASLMPTIPAGAINLACMAIGERMAELLAT